MYGFWRPGHEPGEWKVVAQADRTVVLSAMCRCGDDECAFTLAPDPRDAVQVGPHEPTGTAGGAWVDPATLTFGPPRHSVGGVEHDATDCPGGGAWPCDGPCQDCGEEAGNHSADCPTWGDPWDDGSTGHD